ncbi:MAG: hypothetical protein HQK83_11490 [Fibrobacteria bacterium]|nr:hypothetical protein [Fibrobacteria bacterium]
MNRFIINASIFFSLTALPFVIYYATLLPYPAAPWISNSYSFNEASQYFKKRDKTQLSNLAIGSSMTLNNLNSRAVTKHLDRHTYLNISAWGLTIADVYILLKGFLQEHNLKKVLIVSNYMDFAPQRIQYDPQKWIGYIQGGLNLYYQLKYLDLKKVKKYSLANRANYTSNAMYSSLQFDTYGGVPLATENFTIIPQRWKKKASLDSIDTLTYNYLDSLSTFLASKGVHLIFMQSPLREASKGPDYSVRMVKHISVLENILRSSGHTFIDGSTLEMHDSLFVDYSHLNEKGASIFTLFCMESYFSQKNKINFQAP